MAATCLLGWPAQLNDFGKRQLNQDIPQGTGIENVGIREDDGCGGWDVHAPRTPPCLNAPLSGGGPSTMLSRSS